MRKNHFTVYELAIVAVAMIMGCTFARSCRQHTVDLPFVEQIISRPAHPQPAMLRS